MIHSIRKDIKLSGDRENLSLLFNRLCRGVDEQGEHEEKDRVLSALLNGYSAQDYLPLYKNALKQWQKTMTENHDIICFEMEVASSMVVGKGDQNIHEFGITLQLPWGTPVIPGSAIKGVLSSFAHSQGGEDWHKGALAAKENSLASFSGKLSLIMFGGMNEKNESFAGALDFFDAWWVPGRDKSPFAEDIINVHNRSYYQNNDNDNGHWPDGMDSPMPNKFAVVKPGEKFFFAIKGAKAWRELAKDLLAKAAADYGFGAKTRVGYGRLTYLQTDDELCDGVGELDDNTLAEHFHHYNGNSSIKDAIIAEAKRRDYSPALHKLFRKIRPAACMLHDLLTKPPQKMEEFKNVYNNYKKALKSVGITPQDPDIQEIFRIATPFAPTQLAPWLAAFSPTAKDLLAGKTAEQIETLLENYEQVSPPLTSFKEAINEMPLDEDEKAYLIELFFEEDENIPK